MKNTWKIILLSTLIFNLSLTAQPSDRITINESNSNLRLTIESIDISISIESIMEDEIRLEVKNAAGNMLPLEDYFFQSRNDDEIVVVQKENTISNPISISIKLPAYVPLNIKSASGHIAIKNIIANVKSITKSGKIALTNIKGTVDVKCSTCEIDLKSIRGSVFSVNKQGNTQVDISEITLYRGFEHPAILSSNEGEITLKLPTDSQTAIKIKANIDLVKSDFDMELIERKMQKYPKHVSSSLYSINGGKAYRRMIIIRNNFGIVNVQKRN